MRTIHIVQAVLLLFCLLMFPTLFWQTSVNSDGRQMLIDKELCITEISAIHGVGAICARAASEEAAWEYRTAHKPWYVRPIYYLMAVFSL